MALQVTTNINVDFCDKKYILVNAKQLDKNTRFLSVTCYNHGELYPVNAGEHSAYVRYKKPDEYGVFNLCEITPKGEILIELTEQMLASVGVCFVDLVLVDKGSAVIDENTGKVITINNSGILSTMTFNIDVSEVAVENSEIESSYEYNGLNETLERVEAEYSQVIKMAKSYASGNTGVRDGEDIDNAKYWAELAHAHVLGDLDDKIVTGIKIGNDITYRTGFIDITTENVGAVPITDIATVDETKSYLGII